MTGAPAVAESIWQRGARDFFVTADAFSAGSVDEQIVLKVGVLAYEPAHQLMPRIGHPGPAFEGLGLLGQIVERLLQTLPRARKRSTVSRGPHDRLADTERDELRVFTSSRGVVLTLGQELIRRAEHGTDQLAGVDFHRGPKWSEARVSTVDLDPAAPFPSTDTATAVTSPI